MFTESEYQQIECLHLARAMRDMLDMIAESDNHTNWEVILVAIDTACDNWDVNQEELFRLYEEYESHMFVL